jgi:F-type H+-transporting ATPase subunit delta
MNDSKVARRYAQSLLGLALERNMADKINNDMMLIANTCEQNRDLALLLKNPIVNTEKKDNIIKAVFGSKVDALTNSFMEIITRKGRESYLQDIAKAYVSIYKDIRGIRIAHVTTAFPMDAALRNEVMNIVKRAAGDSAELVEIVDKDIIGGFVLRIGDVQFDASISKKLSALKNEFDENLYVKEL